MFHKSLVKKNTIIHISPSHFLFLIILFTYSCINLEEYNFSKSNVISDLSHLKIELKDDFTIRNNKISGIVDYIQYTNVEISDKDKARLIKLIKESKNFKIYDSSHTNLDAVGMIYNMEYEDRFSRKVYVRIEKFLTRIMLDISKESNLLHYKRIEI